MKRDKTNTYQIVMQWLMHMLMLIMILVFVFVLALTLMIKDDGLQRSVVQGWLLHGMGNCCSISSISSIDSLNRWYVVLLMLMLLLTLIFALVLVHVLIQTLCALLLQLWHFFIMEALALYAMEKERKKESEHEWTKIIHYLFTCS